MSAWWKTVRGFISSTFRDVLAMISPPRTAPAKPTPRFRPIIRVFVSSIFSDLIHERKALQDRVWPELERYCLLRGFQFQVIDLRWGVPTEAGLDHRAMRICFDELRRSQEVSPQPNFLILLGDRYGRQPLPEEISTAEFDTLKQAAAGNQAEIKILEDWYRLDSNARPPAHLLRSRRNSPDGQPRSEPAAGQSDVCGSRVRRQLGPPGNRNRRLPLSGQEFSRLCEFFFWGLTSLGRAF